MAKKAKPKELKLIIEPFGSGIIKESESDRKYIGFKVEVKGLHRNIDHLWINCFIPIPEGDERGFLINATPVLLPTKDLNIKDPDTHKEILALSHRLATTIWTYDLRHKEHEIFLGHALNKKELDQEAYNYFGDLLKKILEPKRPYIEGSPVNTVYIITIEIPDYFFPAPTTMGLVSPVFSMGLQKEVEPIDVKDGYETTLIYLSHEKPQSKAQIQLRLFDSIPEERLKELQRSFKDNLSPYGLKCLYLAIEECSDNKRNPWFILDTNKCLDLMGYKRNKKNVHQTNNKNRLLKEFEALTQINFNIEKREPKGKGNKDKAIKFQAPLLSITGKFEEWEVERDKPIETGKLIKENVQIFLHPEIYKYINNWYTIIPNAFLTIDARSKPHAILLYSYIANQWRIGLKQYQGTIKQTMRQLLDGAGLLSRLPRRANQQRDFVKKIKDDLRWLKSQPVFWIKDVSFEAKKVPIFDQTVIITITDDHPLRSLMKKQIKSG